MSGPTYLRSAATVEGLGSSLEQRCINLGLVLIGDLTDRDRNGKTPSDNKVREEAGMPIADEFVYVRSGPISTLPHHARAGASRPS